MSKTDKDGWIRHRGGKQPLPDDVLTQVILRKESKKQFDDKPFIASAWAWSHCNCGDDVMYYREYKPDEQVEACSKPELQIKLPDGYGEIYNAQAIEHGPLQWRDRITDLDEERKTIDALYQVNTARIETERTELVQKLASEGFALIGRINDLLSGAAQKHEDMSDWRNWKVGDLVECISHDNDQRWSSKFEIGSINKITEVVRGGDSDLTVNIGYYVNPADFKFHSRPSA